jgi:ribosomal protein S27AE
LPRTDWQTLHWDAVLAHKTVARAVKSGRLVPEPCETCGNPVSLAHHDDYDQRLVIRWLCDRHHRLWHIDHPLTKVVLAPPPRAKPVQERSPNRGRRFRQYIKPRVLRLRDSGATYAEISQVMGISTSTAHAWVQDALSTAVDA